MSKVDCQVKLIMGPTSPIVKLVSQLKRNFLRHLVAELSKEKVYMLYVHQTELIKVNIYLYLYSSFYTIVILKIYSKTAWIVNTLQCLQIQLQPSSRKVATNKQGSSCNTLQLPFMLWERGHIKCVLFCSCHCVVGSCAVCWLFSKPTLITFR